ncbi:HAD family hydrolase [Phytoactinopolyspora halotolerans]|uniref:HAD-IA family hydrolase n=1 Tax=Phytoactinopolyspora halotolerans TaxID=1981512 RepID=A0A6L9S7W5_9ACTN|nr:HAD-IA family hydrolase [Phytoactinopolyspora halotolerans]NEE00652.1 HAD-IA family hydrolase [Phytoactinopolyspora halotolerans]
MTVTREPALYLERIAGMIFDVDGVVTDTAALHAEAWKRTFDEFFERRAQEIGVECTPFDTSADYPRFVADRPRREGLRALLSSRGIALAERNGPSGADPDTMWSLAERKDRYFAEQLEAHGVRAYRDVIALLRDIQYRGVATAAVSAGRTCGRLLAASGMTQMFDVCIEGGRADRLRLPGKPDPTVFVEAARRLGVAPPDAVVVEDAPAGVEAGRRGGFGLVIGLDRTGTSAEGFLRSGADTVVGSLHDLMLVGQRAVAGMART